MGRRLGFVLVLVAVAGLGIGWWMASATTSPAPVATATPGPPPSAEDVAAAVDAVLSRAEVGDDGRFAAEVSEEELDTIVRGGLDDADVPVEDLRVDLLPTAADERPRLAFSGRLRQGGFGVTGEVALDVADGRIQPDVQAVKVGVLPLPGAAAEAVEDAVRDATALSDELAAQGIVVDDLRVRDGRLEITGRRAG